MLKLKDLIEAIQDLLEQQLMVGKVTKELHRLLEKSICTMINLPNQRMSWTSLFHQQL